MSQSNTTYLSSERGNAGWVEDSETRRYGRNTKKHPDLFKQRAAGADPAQQIRKKETMHCGDAALRGGTAPAAERKGQEKMKRARRQNKGRGGQAGFTLLEILVVLTVMGFLIAMVAPRLGGIGDDVAETACDTNKDRAKTYVSAFREAYNRYPNRLTNLVMTDGADLAAANAADAGYQIPYCSDDDPGNGPEVIHFGHNNSYKFMIHRLNQAEADELKSLGVTTVFNLNDYLADSLNGAAANGRHDSATASAGDRVSNFGNVTAISDQRPFMETCPVEAGVGVAMCGAGINRAGDTLTYAPPERGWAEEDIFGRIVFGLGPESELVTSGIVANAAHCPGSIRNADNFTWGATT